MKVLEVKNVILLAICSIVLTNVAMANYAEIKDTTISTDIVSLPVYGITEDWGGKTITYSFEVNWASFELLEVVADSNSAVLNNSIKYDYAWQTRLITIVVNDIKPNFGAEILFNMVIRVLTRVDIYHPNEIFTITPKEIKIDDSVIVLAGKTARIEIEHTPNNLTYIEEVSLNYPNPFNYETTILFSLPEESNISFEVYNSSGKCVQKMPDKEKNYSNAFIYEFMNNKLDIIAFENDVLEKGIYRLRLRINRIEIGNGVYYFVVRIGNNVRMIKMGIN